MRRGAVHENFLVATFFTARQPDSAARHVQCMCEESDETLVGLTINRWSLQANAQAARVRRIKAGMRGSRLNAQAQQEVGATDCVPLRYGAHSLNAGAAG